MSDTTTPQKRGPMTRVLIVDDHPILRQGLMQMIDNEPDMVVCAEAEDGPQALDAIASERPDVAVVDISLKGRDGLELVRDLKARLPDLGVLVFSMHEESLYAERALRAGASGYLMKQQPIEEVITALRTVLDGHVYLSPQLSSRVLRRAVSGGGGETAGDVQVADGRLTEHQSLVELLTDRELEVFILLGQGLSPRRIADQLFRSVKTIEAHRENIKSKLGLRTGGELIRIAVEYSLRVDKHAAPAPAHAPVHPATADDTSPVLPA